MDKNDPNGRHILETSTCERDLGIAIANNLYWVFHVKIAANNASNVLGMLKRTWNPYKIKYEQ